MVLIVEDDADIRACLEEVLSEDGYWVESVANGLEALRKIAAAPARYNLMLLDLVMPVMDGPTLLRELSNRHLSLPTLIITASRMPAPKGFEVIPKPFNLETLTNAINRCLEAKTSSL